MMNIWHDVEKSRIQKNDFLSVIEISKGGKNKYELDKKTGMIILDRVLYTSTHYPANYGFIPRTLADDGDPLDVLVLCQEKIDSLVLVRTYPVGVVKMIDNGETDEKIIALPFNDPSYSGYNDVNELPTHISREISHFFEVYKYLENKRTAVKEICGRDEAERIIEKCIAAYDNKFGADKNE